MNHRPIRPVLFAAVLSCLPVVAQTASAVTITNGNMTFTQSVLPVIEGLSTADALDGGGGDILYQHWWWFRVSGDGREYVFPRDAAATRVAGGSSIATNWPDVASRGVFAASLHQDLFSTGANSGYLRERMTIRNLTGSPLTIDLFAYTDFDVEGGGADVTRGNPSSQAVVDFYHATLGGEFVGQGNTRSQVGTFNTVQPLLTNTTVDDLAGWSGEFGPGDCSGAMQWTLTIPVNGAATVTDYLATMACRPQLTTYGSGRGGSRGVPTIQADGFLLQSPLGPRQTRVQLGNGAANALAACLLSLNQGNSNPFGINLLVDLATLDAAFAVTNASGAASRALIVPPSAPILCGVNLFAQWLVSDATAANGLAAWSAGLQMGSGGW